MQREEKGKSIYRLAKSRIKAGRIADKKASEQSLIKIKKNKNN